MRLTTRGRYAVTALIDLALQDSQHNDAVSLSDIAKRQEISISYLEQLFSKLRKQGLVVSIRGASGGYHIAKSLDEISVMDIISAVDESVDARACEGEGNCQDGAMCLTHDLWADLSHHIESYLSKVTLAQLIERRLIRQVAERQMQRAEYDEQPVQLKFTNKALVKSNKKTVKSTNYSQSTVKQNLQENMPA